MKETSRLIRVYRNAMDLSQDDLGRRLGYKCGQTIRNIELERAGLPIRIAPAICRALQIKKDDLFAAMVVDYIDKLERDFNKAKKGVKL